VLACDVSLPSYFLSLFSIRPLYPLSLYTLLYPSTLPSSLSLYSTPLLYPSTLSLFSIPLLYPSIPLLYPSILYSILYSTLYSIPLLYPLLILTSGLSRKYQLYNVSSKIISFNMLCI